MICDLFFYIRCHWIAQIGLKLAILLSQPFQIKGLPPYLSPYPALWLQHFILWYFFMFIYYRSFAFYCCISSYYMTFPVFTHNSVDGSLVYIAILYFLLLPFKTVLWFPSNLCFFISMYMNFLGFLNPRLEPWIFIFAR